MTRIPRLNQTQKFNITTKKSAISIIVDSENTHYTNHCKLVALLTKKYKNETKF